MQMVDWPSSNMFMGSCTKVFMSLLSCLIHMASCPALHVARVTYLASAVDNATRVVSHTVDCRLAPTI